MRCDFVGHPIVAEPVASAGDAAEFRQKIGAIDRKIVLVLPGSRRSEIARMAPVFGETLGLLAKKRSDLKFVLPAALSVRDEVRAAISDWSADVTLIDPLDDRDGSQKRAAFAAADGAVATSGTVALELAANTTPMVIAYKSSWLTQMIIMPMLRVKSVNLVNLVADTQVIPEFIGKDCTAAKIADAADRVLASPETQNAAMTLCMDRLGRGGAARPGDLAAKAVLDGLQTA